MVYLPRFCIDKSVTIPRFKENACAKGKEGQLDHSRNRPREKPPNKTHNIVDATEIRAEGKTHDSTYRAVTKIEADGIERVDPHRICASTTAHRNARLDVCRIRLVTLHLKLGEPQSELRFRRDHQPAAVISCKVALQGFVGKRPLDGGEGLLCEAKSRSSGLFRRESSSWRTAICGYLEALRTQKPLPAHSSSQSSPSPPSKGRFRAETHYQ
ncbi:hypothetical protein [Raoultibacter phocaeensis]|uniref:hypothetical protein n=1 Tax=Raoultibacter phocaeensis TaxID=2479841 RepID=UPI00111B5D8E|nr:hypothetical protein [Raoultibacter phocaeensis]